MDLSDSCTSSHERALAAVHEPDGVDEVTASLEDVTLADISSLNVQQVDKVNEVTGSLGSITLTDTPSKDVAVVQNAVKYNNIEKSTIISGTVQITNHARQASETEIKQSSATIDDEHFLREQLQPLECPFKWKIKKDTMHGYQDLLITRISEKMEEISEDGPFQWRTFILLLIICYECFRKGDISDSWAKLRNCETYLNPSDSKGVYESFFEATRDALSHVVYACKCHLFFKSGILNEAKQTLLNVCKYEDMNNACKAAIWGIRAAVSMEYGYEGTKAAMGYIKKALELDAKQGEWHFLLGKCLGRIRRIETYNEVPPQEEFKALENAAQMTKNPSYIIFLAQAHREASFRLFSIHRENLAPLREKLDGMNERSAQLYRAALVMRGDCAHINIRCAQGFCKLPYPYKDIKLAKECCDKALLLAPNNAMANHVAGSICEMYEANLEEAKKYYQSAGEQGSYGAFMDLYKLKYNEDQTYDPIPDFEFLLSRFTEKPRIEETLCQMGSFYLFLKDDLATAYRKYWSKVISENPESDRLKAHKCCFVRMKTPVNIYEMIFDEARIRLKERNCKHMSDEDCKLFREIVIEQSMHLSQLSLNSPKPRRKMALEEAESRSFPGRRGRNRGRGGSRGRGKGGGRGRSRGGVRGRSSGGGRGRSKDKGNDYRNSLDRYNGGKSRDSSCDSKGRYYKRDGSRDSSTDRSGSRGRYCWRDGNRDSITESMDGGHRRGRGQNGESVVGRSNHRYAIDKHTYRDSSTESRSINRGGYHQKAVSRDSSTESRSITRGGYHQKAVSRDSSTESKNITRGGYHQKAGSRDSSTERRDRHYSKERNVGISRYERRDSSNDSRSSQNKNWRSGPRDYDQIGKGKLTYQRDSSCSSVEGQSHPFTKHNDGHRETRTSSVSSVGRIRTESNSSVGSDTHRDWKEGCLGGGPRNRNNNRQVGEGSNFELKFPENQNNSSNWGSWRTVGNSKHDFQRGEDQRQGYQKGGERRPAFHGSAYYDREEARHRNMNQESRSRSSDKCHQIEKSDAMGASASNASQGEGKLWGSQNNSRRGRYKVKETNFKLSWRNSTN